MDQIKWCDPPTKVRSIGHENKWKRLLRPLMERPGSWALISFKANEARASALAYYLRSGKAKIGEGEWEFLSRGTGVWGRFLKGRQITEITTQGEEEVRVAV